VGAVYGTSTDPVSDGKVSFTFTPPAAPAGATRFVPLSPFRLLDTRDPADITAGTVVSAGGQINLQVSGRAGVPNVGVTSVVLNVTAAEAVAPGFVTLWPTGKVRPTASNLNVTASGQNIANLVTVSLSALGVVSLYSQSGTHLVVDVAGYYEEVPTVSTFGRLTSLTPTRILDTRDSVGIPGTDKVPPDGTIDLAVADHGGVPKFGASAVVLNITAADATAPGFVTVWPAGSIRPLASNLNATFTGQNIANLAIVPLSAAGSVSLYTQGGAHLIADVVGWFGSSQQNASLQGLFVPLAPTRLLDTRLALGVPGTGPVPPDGTIPLTIADRGGVPVSGAGTVVMNVTAAESSAPGFVTVWPTGIARPLASNLNVTAAGQNIPNLTITALGGGGVSLYSQGGTHLVADVEGYYLDA
jgi:hypothetical protein